jgi:hypothetical protein
MSSDSTLRVCDLRRRVYDLRLQSCDRLDDLRLGLDPCGLRLRVGGVGLV